jgi:TonB family protein
MLGKYMKSRFIIVLCFALAGPITAQTNDATNQPATNPNPPSSTLVPDSTKLEVLDHPLTYPAEAHEKGIEGQVIVNISVAENGTVTDVQGVSGDPILLHAAVDAVKQWTFKPYIKNGKPVQVSVNLPVNFHLSPLDHPVPVKTVKPRYPDIAQDNEIQGQVSIKVHVTERGDVDEVQLVSSTNHSLEKAAMDAVRQWKFRPAVRDGKPISSWTVISTDFAFSDKIHDENISAAGTSSNSVVLPSKLAQGNLIHSVAPVYPPNARGAHVSGAVTMSALISKEGKVTNIKVISGSPLLINSAVGAITQWRYRPYIQNGQPVEVKTEITVIFSLGG